MANLSEYKCPACGAPMEFDSQTQKMKCPFCDTTMSIEDYNTQVKKETGETEAAVEEKIEMESTDGFEYWSASETAGMKVYSCQSCGGEIVADETIGATTCPYCGNNVVMKGQFAGDLKPNFVIPFKKDKKQAKEAYYKHLEGRFFLPRIFKDANHIDEIKGVYVPFWLYDASATGDVTYAATRVHTSKTETATSETTHTTTEYFQLNRSGVVTFEKVPADGSTKMDDDLMDSVEPFDFKELVPFSPAYLAGYLAERYDLTAEETLKRAKDRIMHSTDAKFSETTNGGYSTVNLTSKNINIRNTKTYYCLLPVWILNTTWEGKQFIFAMNGQTGKIVGDLPCDEAEYKKYIRNRGLITSAIIFGIIWLLLMFKLI